MISNGGNVQRVGFIGCGSIGATAISLIDSDEDAAVDIVGVLVRSGIHDRVSNIIGEKMIFSDIGSLVEEKPDLIVECAGHAALKMYGAAVLESGIDLLVVSVGALADEELLSELTSAASKGGSKIRISSGAVGGFDWLGASKLLGFSDVTYRTKKPPQAWTGTDAPSDIVDAVVFYSSNVKDAASRYPKNVNAAAAVALASVGLERTKLELVSDPAITENIHEIEAVGTAGKFTLTVSNFADPHNPKTSMITGCSVANSILRDQSILVF